MPEIGVPEYVPSATAALIVGISEPSFRRRLVETGLVDVVPDTGRLMVATASIERATGKEISCRDYCQAERARDPRRQYQRDYRARHAAS